MIPRRIRVSQSLFFATAHFLSICPRILAQLGWGNVHGANWKIINKSVFKHQPLLRENSHIKRLKVIKLLFCVNLLCKYDNRYLNKMLRQCTNADKPPSLLPSKYLFTRNSQGRFKTNSHSVPVQEDGKSCPRNRNCTIMSSSSLPSPASRAAAICRSLKVV